MARIPSLERVDLGKSPITAVGFRHLSALRLKSLDTHFCDNASLEVISQMTQLTELVLSRTSLTETGLQPLGRLKNLERLSLSADLHDESLVFLADLKQLQHLSLFMPHVTDKGLRHLRGLTKIRKLTIHANITDVGLESLREMHRLGNLEIRSFSPITGRGFAHLTHLQELGVLELSKSDFSDEGLLHLAAFKNLVELRLDDTQITGRGLSKLTQVARLHLDNTPLMDEGFTELGQLSNLREMSLLGIPLTETRLVPLKRLQEIEWLLLSRPLSPDELLGFNPESRVRGY